MPIRSRVLMFVLATSAVLLALGSASAQDCACRDTNHNGICDVGETIVPKTQWIGPGAIDIRPASFTIPKDCDFILSTSPSKPIQVTAANHFLFGDITIGGNGGQGVLFIALADGDAAKGHIVVGDAANAVLNWKVPGQNKLIDKQPANTAIAKASIGFKADHTCTISNAYLEAQPIAGSAQIGMQCGDDILFRKATLYTSGFDIQSLNGAIDLSNVSASGPPETARWCDLDDDGIADLPCTITTEDQRSSFCTGTPEFPLPSPGAGAGPNSLRAVANPGVLVAKTAIRAQSDSAAPSSQNLIEGRYALTIIAEDGTIDLTNAKVTNTTNFQSGSKIWLAADPGLVDRYSLGILKEKFYGDCTGSVTVNASTCLFSPNPILVCGTVVGGPPSSTSPCRSDMTPVASGGF